MIRRRFRILTPVFMIASGIALALISAAFAPTLRLQPALAAAALYQASTATPAAAAASRAGSTNGIMLMGLVIVVIVLLPIVFRRGMWSK
jgi:hypothetical protein